MKQPFKSFRCRCKEGQHGFTSMCYWYGKKHSHKDNGTKAICYCRFCGREVRELTNGSIRKTRGVIRYYKYKKWRLKNG